MLITEQRVKDCLEELGVPYRFYQFEKDEASPPPFIVYLMPDTDNFAADNEVYQVIENFRIEYYYDQRDLKQKEKIESTLTKNGFVWNQIEHVYLEHPDNMFIIVYEIS